MNQTIGTKIQMLRKQNGMSQQNLADKLNITRQTISKWESDQSLPDLDTLLKMAELFNVSIAYIVGVEEEDKPISQMYELMQTMLSNQQKANKTRNIIQAITILLCVLSLFLNISVRREIATPKVDSAYQQNNNSRFDMVYSFTEDEFDFILDNPYLASVSYIHVVYYDLNKMEVCLNGDFYLAEYNANTKATLEFYRSIEEGIVSVDLIQKDKNFYVLNAKIPLDNYNQIMLRIDDGKGNIKSTDLTESAPNDYFNYALYSQINLFVPVDDNGKLQLNKLEFDPTYYNTNGDNRYMGYFDGYLTIKLYTESANTPIKEFDVSFDKKEIINLSEKLPLNTPIYFEIGYFVPDRKAPYPYQGHIGGGDVRHEFSFVITNTNERVRIFQKPEYYSEAEDLYYFKDQKRR